VHEICSELEPGEEADPVKNNVGSDEKEVRPKDVPAAEGLLEWELLNEWD